ncbi:hypothetical protein, partial [Mesorhizobium sp. M0159]|uniref:hypothetical protein n=1 Tax=unclassified Mesorhizobium TaxID=325217 RepID=UPI00333960E3
VETHTEGKFSLIWPALPSDRLTTNPRRKGGASPARYVVTDTLRPFSDDLIADAVAAVTDGVVDPGEGAYSTATMSPSSVATLRSRPVAGIGVRDEHVISIMGTSRSPSRLKLLTGDQALVAEKDYDRSRCPRCLHPKCCWAPPSTARTCDTSWPGAPPVAESDDRESERWTAGEARLR